MMLVRVLAVLLLMTGIVSAAPAYPVKPIVLLCWSAAGSPLDLLAREIAKQSPKYFKQPMAVENRPGGDGATVMADLLAAPADGYTLAVNTASMTASLNTDLKGKFTPDQFSFLAVMETDPYVLAVASASPYKTFADLVAAAKAGPIAVGGFGAQSGASFFANQIESAAHVKFTWVPFGGGSAALAATMGGHIAATVVGLSGVTEQFESGQLRILGIATNDPLPQLHGVPTFASLGYKDLTTALWRGVMTRAGVPTPVETQLVEGLRQIYNDPEFQTYIKSSGLLPVFTAHDDFTKLVQRDMATVAAQVAKPG